MKTIGIVLKKELKRYLTDIRMLIMLLLPGVLIFVLYSLMGNFANSTGDVPTDYSICIVNEPVEFSEFKSVEGWTIQVLDSANITKEEALSKIEAKEMDLYIEYESDFYEKMLSYDALTSTSPAPQVKIYYNSASTSSSTIYEYFTSVLSKFESQLSNRFDINASLNEKYDYAREEDVSAKVISMILPFLLMIFLFSGCMSVCSESIAGEKERGTIATLLVTPAKRSELAIGKILALSITSLISATASFIGLIASLPNLIGTANFNIGIGSIILLFAVILTTVLIFSVILTIVSTFAKSVKEANGLSVPVMMLVMLLSVTSMTASSAATNIGLYFIPIYNSIQCFTAILSMEIQPLMLAITIVTNIVFVGVGVCVLTKMFNSEKIMFNK